MVALRRCGSEKTFVPLFVSAPCHVLRQCDDEGVEVVCIPLKVFASPARMQRPPPPLPPEVGHGVGGGVGWEGWCVERCGTVCGRRREVREEGGGMEVVGCGEGVWEGVNVDGKGGWVGSVLRWRGCG